MGDISKSILGSDEGETDQAPEAEQTTGLSSLIVDGTDQDSAKLGLSVKFGAEQNADETARVLRLQSKTGLPEDLIRRNLDKIEAQVKTADFDPAKFRQSSPVLSQWMSEHPNNAAVAFDDIHTLSYLERQLRYMSSQFQQGQNQMELSNIGTDAMLGTVTPEQRRRQEAIETESAQTRDYGIDGFFEQIPGAISNFAPMFGQTLFGKAKAATAGGYAGAIVGGAAGALAGGAGAIPGALAMGSAGFGLGWEYGSAVEIARQEASLAYLDYEKLKDEDGNTIPRDTALGAAGVVGVINGALGMIPFEHLAQTFPVLRNVGRQGVKQILQNPSMRQAFTSYASTVGKQMAEQGGIGFIQSFVRTTSHDLLELANNGELAKMSTGQLMAHLLSTENIEKAKENFKVGVQIGATAIGTAGFDLARDIRRAKSAQTTSAAFAELGQKVQDLKLFEKLPEATQEVMERLTKDGPVETVYAPVESWNTYWQGKNVDPREAAQEVLGDTKSYDQAQITGEDLAIPTARYAVTIAPSDHNTFFAQELRSDPTEMNGRESKEFIEGLQKERDNKAKDQEEDKAAQETLAIHEQVTGQLKEAGFDEKTAGTYATLFNAFGTMGQRTGQSPADIFNQYKLRIQKAQEGNNTASGENPEGGQTLEQGAVPKAPPFYSKLQRTVEEKMGTTASVEQIKGMLKDIKAEERKWLGIDDFLKGKEKVSKEELLEHIRGNQVEIKEVTRADGENQPIPLGSTVYQIFTKDGEGAGIFVDKENAKTMMEKGDTIEEVEWDGESTLEDGQFHGEPYPPTKYSNFTLPGGENYREMLFTLPGETKNTLRQNLDNGNWEIIDPTGKLVEWYYPNDKADAERAIRHQTKYKEGNFNSPHWNEPNVLAHTRLTDRVDNEGKKVLFVEEIQSDWHHDGRVKGYKEADRETAKKDFDAYRKKLLKKYKDVLSEPTTVPLRELTAEEKAHYDKLGDRINNALNGVADAPFRSTWQEYVLKRLVRYASENGYDKIAWTTGRQQVDRFGLHGRKKSIDGMHGFYDKIIPDFLRKFGKKFDATVGETEIPVTKNNLDMRHEYQGPERSIEQIKEVLKNHDPADWPMVDQLERVIKAMEEGQTLKEALENEGTEASANLIGWEYKRFGGDHIAKVQSLDITPKLKNAALTEGFSLFQSAPNNRSKLHAELSNKLSRLHSVFGDALSDILGDKPVSSKSELDATGTHVKDLAKLLEGHIIPAEKSGLEQVPSLLPVFMEMRSAILKDPKILDTIIGSVPVDMVNNLFGSESAAKVALHDEAMLKDGSAFDADLPISGSGVDTTNPVSLLLREVALVAAKAVDVSLRSRLKAEEDAAALNASNRNSFSQDDGSPRARITFGSNKTFNIELLKNADLTSFLHESGHFYLEVLGDIANADTATDQIKADYQTVLHWFGVDSRENITREHHEKWADAFESYLMTGKAPSASLRQAFARFKVWLTEVYGKLSKAKFELTPEVKGVFDRLLATDEEIKAAEAEQGMEPLFPDPESVGMKPLEAKQYSESILEARAKAQDDLTAKVMQDVSREQRARYKEERGKIRDEVETQVNERPEQIALSVLGKGKLPDGSELPENLQGLKLSKEAILEGYGADRLKSLPKPYVYSKEGGMHPDQAAELFGYKSGDELLYALSGAEKRDALIERLTNERMTAEHGGLLTDGKLPAEAMKAIHNEKRAQLLRSELQHLVSQDLATAKKLIKKLTRRIPTIELIRDQAQKAIAQMSIRAINPFVHQRAEARAGREAMEAFLKGDIEGAFEAKQRELINHEYYRAATEAREQTDKIVERMQKFSKEPVRRRLGLAGADYLPQIDAILERFDFNQNVSLKAIDKRKTLAEFVKSQEEMGFEVDIPEALLSEANRKHYKDLTYSDLKDVSDTVKMIEHLAGLKNKLLASSNARDLAEARANIIAAILSNHTLTESKPERGDPNLQKRLAKAKDSVISTHTRMEFLFEHLDGNKPHGPVWEALFKPMADAENHEVQMMRDLNKNLHEIFSVYPKKEIATWFYKKTHIPEIGESLTKINMIFAALNWGNAYNREALMRGETWTESQVQAIFKHLDKRDWDTVQKIWDQINSYWPEAEKLEKDLTGIAPEKVEAVPIETPYGTYPGGYYPIVFDSKRSQRHFELEEMANVKDMFGGNYGRAATKRNHLKARKDTGGKPLILELGGLTRHFTDVIHDLAYRRAVIDVGRLISSEEVRKTMEGAVGQEMYRQLKPWLKSIAGDTPKDPSNVLEGFMSKMRMGSSVVNMGWKISTGIIQSTAYLVSVKELGAKYAGMGLRDTFGKPFEIKDKYEFAAERSELMRTRVSNWDRDVRDFRKKIGAGGKGPLDLIPHEIADSYFMTIGYMDMAASLPTWLGAYRKAMDGAVDNIGKGDEKAAIDFADRTVRMAQGSGSAKDLASIQKGSEAFKLFTMFYSWSNVMFNQLKRSGDQYAFDKNMPKLVASLFLLWFAPAVLESTLVGRTPEVDDDKEKWAKWIAAQELQYPFQTVVLLRDIIKGMDDYGYKASPAFDAIEHIPRVAKIARDTLTGQKEELKRQDYKAMVHTIGYFGALPTKQVWNSAEYLHDWLMTGEEEPGSLPMGLWRTLVTGKKKK